MEAAADAWPWSSSSSPVGPVFGVIEHTGYFVSSGRQGVILLRRWLHRVLVPLIKGRRGSYFRAGLPVLMMADLTPAAGCDLGTTRGLLSAKSRAGRRSYFTSAHRCLRPRAASGGLLSFANRKCAGRGIWCG